MDQYPAGITRLTVAETVVEIWAEDDPAAAFTWVARQPLSLGSKQLFRAVGSAAGSQGLKFAMELANQLPDSAVQKEFRESAYRGFAYSDPSSAWETVSQMESGELKNELVKATISTMGRTDPIGAIKLLSTLTDVNGVSILSANLIDQIGDDDLPTAIELVQLLPNVASRDNALLRLINGSGRENLTERAIVASAISPGPAAAKALAQIARDYAIYKPEEALSWLNTLPQDSAKDAAIAAMLGPVYTTDPSTAMTLVLGLPPGESRTNAISTIARMWNQIDASEAVEWAKTLKGDDRSAALGSLTLSWLSLQPAQATAFLANLSTEDLNSQFLNESTKYLGQNPSKATQIVDNLPESNLRRGALETMVKKWRANGAINIGWETHPLRSWQLSDPGKPAEWINSADLPAKIKTELLHITAGGTLPIK